MRTIKNCKSIEQYIKIRKNPSIDFKDIIFSTNFDFMALFSYANENNNTNLLADCYFYGLGVKKNRRKAKAYLLRNVSKNNAHIIYEYAIKMYNPRNYNYDIADMLILASLFGIDSYEEIGNCYYRPSYDHEDDVDSDIDDAVYWYTKGAENENIECMKKLVEIFSNIIYDCYDLDKAKFWERKSI